MTNEAEYGTNIYVHEGLHHEIVNRKPMAAVGIKVVRLEGSG